MKQNPGGDSRREFAEGKGAGEGRKHVEIIHFERGTTHARPVPRNDRQNPVLVLILCEFETEMEQVFIVQKIFQRPLTKGSHILHTNLGTHVNTNTEG